MKRRDSFFYSFHFWILGSFAEMERILSQQEEEEEDEVVIHLTSKNPQVNSCFHQAFCSVI